MKATFYPIVFTVEKDTVVWINRNSIAYRWSYDEGLATQMASHYNAVKMEVKLNYWDTLTWMDIKCIPCKFKGHWCVVDITKIEENRIKLFLADIQYKAEKEYAECSQDTHSQDFKQWVEDRSNYYNNGFYEYSQKHNIKTKDIRTVSDIINKRFNKMYVCYEHKSDKYSDVDSTFTIAKYGNKYIVYGEGTDSCGSDWMNFFIFRTYDKLEDVMEKELHRPTVRFEEAEGTDVLELYSFAERHRQVNIESF